MQLDGGNTDTPGGDVGEITDLEPSSHAGQGPRPTSVPSPYNVGYFPDGTSNNKVGYESNYPVGLKAHSLALGSAPPAAKLVNLLGFLPEETAMNLTGNEIYLPDTIKPDLHTTEFLLALSEYAADVGNFADTPAKGVANSSKSRTQKSTSCGYMYGYLTDVHVDLEFGDDVGNYPDGAMQQT